MVEKKSQQKKELVIRDKSYNLQKISDMTSMASILRSHIVKHKLYTEIKGKNYVHVEGWAFAGGLMGLFPRVISVENLSNDKEKKWKADVEIVETKTGKVMSNGFAVCSSEEFAKKKAGFEEYAVLSMAQTRAISKGYRNIIGWVIKLSGYEPTPAEEMEGKEKDSDKDKVVEISQEDFEGIAEEVNDLNNTQTIEDLKSHVSAIEVKMKAGEYVTPQYEYLKMLIKKVATQIGNKNEKGN